MKYFVMVSVCFFSAACKQATVVGDNNEGASGAGNEGGAGDGGAAAPVGGNTGGNGNAPDPEAICEARASCQQIEASCVYDMTCTLVIFRPEFHTALASCLAVCGEFDDCWSAATAGSTPPNEFAAYVSSCNQNVVACEGNPDGMGQDWCEYDFMTADAYAEMLSCFSLPCGEVNSCLRAVVFEDEPTCIEF